MCDKKPVVSVVIPTYRHRDYILRTLDSVFAQTFTDYEVIVVNDGSPDDTDSLLIPLGEVGKIRYIRQENGGQSVARNRGIAAARGEFLALLDDDDLWPADKLEWQVAALQEDPKAALVYGRVLAIDGNGSFFTPKDSKGDPLYWLSLGPDGNVHEAFMKDNHIVSPGQCLIRRTCLETLGPAPFDPAIKGGCDDWELYLRLSRQFPFASVDRDALHYRVHDGNASNNTVLMYFSMLALRRKMYAIESDRDRKALWRANYESYADWLTLSALKSFTEARLRKQGWTRSIALKCLWDLAPFALKGLVRRASRRRKP